MSGKEINNNTLDLREKKSVSSEFKPARQEEPVKTMKSEHRREFEARIERIEEKKQEDETPKEKSFEEELVNNEAETLEPKEQAIKKSPEKIEKNIFFDGAFSDIPRGVGKIKFPEDFLWGTSTSAYQVEGGINSDWGVWEKSEKRKEKLKKEKKKVADYICGDAVDSCHKWKEDLELARDLSTNVIRLGISWARIQPKKNTWDVGAINHYRKVLEGAQKRGLKTVVTLWHWTNPVWLSKEKGWENKAVVEYFKEYTKMIVEEFGGLVDFWVTLNEPMVPIVNGYINGKFPPNKKLSFRKVGKVFRNLYKAHIVSYKVIHDYFPDSQVSITNLINYFEPARKWLFPEMFLAKLFAYFSNTWFLNKIKKHIDYIGVDYYFHDRIVMYPPFKKNENVFTTDLHWEIFPKGIYHVLKDLKKYKLPVYVMENGLADEKDRYRAQFIKEHLYWIWRAMEEGVDVRGYFYWSLLDNFEWDKGFGPRFGLYAVDRKTMERKKRKSADIYADICKKNLVTF